MSRDRKCWEVVWLDAMAAADEGRDLAEFGRERECLNRGHAVSIGRKLLSSGCVCGTSVEVRHVSYFRDEYGVPDERVIESFEVRL